MLRIVFQIVKCLVFIAGYRTISIILDLWGVSPLFLFSAIRKQVRRVNNIIYYDRVRVHVLTYKRDRIQMEWVLLIVFEEGEREGGCGYTRVG